MTTQELEKAIVDHDRNINEIWAMIKATNQTIEKTSKAVEETTKAVGKLSNKWGLFVENVIAPGIPRVFQERGIEIHVTFQRVKASKKGHHMEIDIVGANGNCLVLVSVKSTLTVDNVKKHLEDLAQFKSFFPHYEGCQVYGAVAGIEIVNGVGEFAYNQGLWVIGQTGDMAVIKNDTEFKPKVW